MSRKWSTKEREEYFKELTQLYIRENKTIKEIGLDLGVSEKTVYKRLCVLGIGSIRAKKPRYNNQQTKIRIPIKRTARLAEFFGVMLGDGRLSSSQIIVTLGNKETLYVEYVKKLIEELFGVLPKVSVRKLGYHDILTF